MAGFRYVTKSYTQYSYAFGKVYTHNQIGIGIQQEGVGFVVPSPLTNYIIMQFADRGKQLTTQKNAASEIVKFLNFCINQIENDPDFEELKTRGLFALDLIHGAKYINWLTMRANAGEIKDRYPIAVSNHLAQFYEWLVDQKIARIEEISNKLEDELDEQPYASSEKKIDVHLTSRSQYNKFKVKSIFKRAGARFPYPQDTMEKISDFGPNRLALAYKFIDICEVIAPEIALGVCFQFFGGLRRSEVINLTKDAFHYPPYHQDVSDNRKTMIIHVSDRQNEVFTHLNSLVREQVKRPRLQSVMPFQKLFAVLRRHKERLRQINPPTNAIFVDPKTGLALSGKQYATRFNAVKAAFLEQLSKENHIDYDFLADNPWATHIGRGVFTNILLDQGADLISIAIARGDKTLDTVIKYVDARRAIEQTQEAVNSLKAALVEAEQSRDLNEMKTMHAEKKAIINLDAMKNWKGE